MAPSLNAAYDVGSGTSGIPMHNLTALALGAGTLFVLWRLAVVVYRLTLHPLARYPGPKLYAATNLPFQWGSNVAGDFARASRGLHQKYGPIVRIAPDHLAVDGSIGWPQVFQHRPGKGEWPKQQGWYFPDDHLSLVGGDYENHKRLRRQLNHAFSNESMYEQEPVVQKYTGLFLSQLGAKAAAGEAFDIVPWLNFLAFDIIGDLAFADSFHSLEDGEYHPWVLGISKSAVGSALNRFTAHYPAARPLVSFLDGRTAGTVRREAENRRLASDKAMARKAQGGSPGGRRDLMTFMLRDARDGRPGFDDTDILMNAPLVVSAGSETTATAIAGFAFHLGLPAFRPVYDALAAEIRAAFGGEADIDMRSTARLPYLVATIEESLRMYPPAAQTPPRISPGAELEGRHVPKGTAITIFQYATYRNPSNFHDPDNMHPERWLPETHPLYDPVFANDNKASFQPFSLGTRNCLGKNLAYSEMRVAIARFLFRFDYELAPGQEDWMDRSRVLVVWEKGPLRVKLTERNLAPVG